MPKLWKDTVEEHRRDVRAAILDAAWTLAQERGVRGVTMALVAEYAGISRATLYKYFRGVDEILVAGHTEHVQEHLGKLQHALAGARTRREGLELLVDHWAEICFHRGRDGTPDTIALVHSGDQHRHNTNEVERLFLDAVSAAQKADQVRADVTPQLLATYCLRSAEGAGSLATMADVRRLANMIKECLRRGPDSTSPTPRP